MINRKLIQLQKVKEITTFSRSTIYRLIDEGKFPKQVKIGERRSVWIKEEVEDYINSKINNR